jgi:formate dehydrogenase iron-sulfur subunit
MQTPLEEFIDYKADTGMQCGNYSIDLPELKEGEQYRFHFDATACVGCRCCEVACNEQNNNPADIKWRRVGEMEGGTFPDTLLLFNSMSCNHCVDPACLIGCPTESYIKIEETGIVFHDDDVCIGCQYCTWNCPYGVPTYHEERNIVTKCHMCHERLAQNQSPACVQACPSGAIEIETVNITDWLDVNSENGIDTQGNMPHLVDARQTNSTTRFTLPENMPEIMEEADAHHLKPAHSEMPLVFMTVLTQISLGAFFALFLGDFFSLLGLPEPSWIMAAAVVVPAAVGLPLSALHLGRPFMAMMAMKNYKTSWLSREAIALGAFTGMMSVNVGLYLTDVSQVLRVSFEGITLVMGILGIHSQAMIYRIKARPSWDRKTTNLKFFGTAYIGLFLVAFIALVMNEVSIALPLISGAMVMAVAHGFFSYEDRRTLLNASEDAYQLKKTEKLYKEFFPHITKLRISTFLVGAVILPLFATMFIVNGYLGLATIDLFVVVVLISISELSDRFLFYSTVVPLQMAGGFFVGKQRH